MRSVKEWWNEVIHKKGQSKKVMESLAMLVSWKVWKERNSRVFQTNASTTMMIIYKIKEKTALWSLVGAKALGNVLSQE
jgi:hypothetical protein